MSIPIFSILLVGDSKSGKKCILLVQTMDYFPEEYRAVIDDYHGRIMIDGELNHLNLYTSPSADDCLVYRKIQYPRLGDCYLICFSIADRNSFENVKKKWLPEIKLYAKKKPIIVVGTKIDLRESEPDAEFISFDEGTKLAKEIKAHSYMECSAKKNQGINEIFTEAVNLIKSKSIKKKPYCLLL